jgi:hypothetical protein
VLVGGEMIRKSLLPIALILVMFMLAGCGGGTGSSSAPTGVHSTVPSIVQLLAVQQTVQTNSYISLRAKVLDGNGAAIAGVPVVFTNLSVLGVLSSSTAATDSLGYATVTVFSSEAGFATIQAEVNSGTGKVRDKKTVFFSTFDLFPITGGVGVPTLTLAVDNNNDGSFNDPSDFFLLGTTDEAIIRATVLDAAGTPVLNDTVTFGADSTEATFPDGAVKQTNSAGEAFARLKVVPTELRNLTTPLNINAKSLNTGAFNVLTLFLEPITVSSVKVTANPGTIDTGGTSTVTANVTTTAGTPVPDGTSVNFTISPRAFGGIEPYVQTTNGLATATYSAPSTDIVSPGQVVTVTATVTGVSGSDSILVKAAPEEVEPTPLAIGPASAAVSAASAPTSVTFTVSGGTAPYVVTAACSTGAVICNDTTGTLGVCDPSDVPIWNTSSTFKVTIGGPSTAAGSCTFTATDFVGDTATAKLTIL